MSLPRTVLTALVLTAIAPAAWAQTPPPAASPWLPAGPPAAAPTLPTGYAPPPAGYAPPPSSYAPPPAGYALPPAGNAPPPGYSYPPRFGAPAPLPVGPETLPYEKGYPIPEGYHPEMRSSKGLVIGGAITFGVLYGLSVSGVLISGGGAKAVLVPIAGPFIEIANIPRTLSGSEASGLRALATVFMILDGVGQIAGATMVVVGLTHPTPVLVRNNVPGATVRVTPLTMGNGGMGIGIVGMM